MKYYVEIVQYGEPETVVKRMGPMSKRAAEKVGRGANMNLNHQDFFTRIVPENE